MNAKRLGIEALLVIVLALCAVAVWWWKDREIAAEGRRWESQVAAVEQEAELEAAKLAAREAEAVFRAFAAGITPRVLAEDDASVDQAVVGLLELPRVVFVHVLAPDGTVIASSDRKLMTAGKAGDSARWALDAAALATRSGDRTGVFETAAPIPGPTGPKAQLWMGYDISAAPPPGPAAAN